MKKKIVGITAILALLGGYFYPPMNKDLANILGCIQLSFPINIVDLF